MPTAIRILFVEDSVPDVEEMLHVLRKADFVPEWERYEELQHLKDSLARGDNWDVILCDHSLPGFTSLDALEVIKTFNRQIPFIIVSGVVDDDTAVIAMKRGACDFLKKDRLSRLPSSIEREMQESSNRIQLDKARNDLKITEDYFRLLMDAARDYAILILDCSGTVVTWNAGAEHLFGYANDRAIGMSFADLYELGEDSLDSAKILNRTIQSGHYEDEALRQRQDKAVFWAHSVMIPLYSVKNELKGFSQIIRDIDARKKHDDELREARLQAHVKDLALKKAEAERIEFEVERKNLNNLFEQSPFVVAVTTGEGHLLSYVNESFSHTLGEGWLGKSLKEDNVYLGSLLPEIQNVFESGSSTQVKELCLTIKGEVRYFDFILSVKKDVSDHNDGVILLGTEITRQLLARHAAEAASASKSAFLANMSHEIRTPLSAILGFSEFLKDVSLSVEERDRYIETINRNSHALAQIIDDILDMAKIEAGKLDIETIDFSLVDLMNEIVAMFSEKSRQKQIFLNLQIPPIMPHFFSSDPTRIRQILFNIVGNAIKFTEKGGVSIDVRMKDRLGDQATLVIDVTDTGRGMSDAQTKRLFQPFMQADNTTTRQFGGTGLGLALAQRLAVALGGSVSIVQSQLAWGSTFRVELKAKLADISMRESTVSKSAAKENSAKRRLEGLHILVVDDTVDNQFLVKRFLTRNGAEVELAGDGSIAVEKALASEFDLVLMDIQMPVMDGYQAMAALRSLAYDKPVVALTAHALLEERIRTVKAGFTGYLTKPFDNQALIDTIMLHTGPKALQEYPRASARRLNEMDA